MKGRIEFLKLLDLVSSVRGRWVCGEVDLTACQPHLGSTQNPAEPLTTTLNIRTVEALAARRLAWHEQCVFRGVNQIQGKKNLKTVSWFSSENQNMFYDKSSKYVCFSLLHLTKKKGTFHSPNRLYPKDCTSSSSAKSSVWHNQKHDISRSYAHYSACTVSKTICSTVQSKYNRKKLNRAAARSQEFITLSSSTKTSVWQSGRRHWRWSTISSPSAYCVGGDRRSREL